MPRIGKSVFRSALILVAGVFAALSPAAAADLGPMLGRWDGASTDCRYPQGDGVFVIERGAIRFFEAICRIDSVSRAGVGSAVTLRMTCEGEGEDWSEDVFMARTEENTLMVYYGSGYGFIAGRCG